MSSNKALTAVAGLACLAFLLFGSAACGNSTTPNGGGGGGTSQSFTSTNVNGHTHQVSIQRAEVETPPAAGISKTTTVNSAHSHSFAMTQAELNTVNGGTAVMVTSGSSPTGGDHTHQFTITKWF